MGYTVGTRAGKTGPINRVPPTPRVGDWEPSGKRTIYDHDGGVEARVFRRQVLPQSSGIRTEGGCRYPIR